MRILLSYSKFHFNPEVDEESIKYSESSAAINAKTLYKVLKCFGDVDYIDFNEWETVIGKEYDLFVGINHNFDNILSNVKIKTSIYYAVNQHPVVRNRILDNFKLSNKISEMFPKCLRKNKIVRKIFNYQLYEEYAPEVKSINKANYIICLGNDIVKNSYINQGYQDDRIFLINYEILKGKAKPKKSFSPSPKILYVGSELCERKGFDIVYELI